jgi:hypothetical protein
LQINQSINTSEAMQGQHNGNDNLGNLIRNMAFMIHDEPTVQMAIRTLQSHCLLGGIQLRYCKNMNPTPNFAMHLKRYFTPFCRDAIQSFLTVGFAPYRIRLNEKGAKIPEILPFGTFSWQVARSNQGLTATPWGRIGDPPSKPSTKNDNGNEAAMDTQPLLRYEIHSSHCKEAIKVHSFTPPQSLSSCTSVMSSLINPYLQLCQTRDCTNRANLFNSQPSLIFEQQEKHSLDEVAQTGQSINGPQEARDGIQGGRASIDERQKLFHDVIENARSRSRLPDEAVTLIAPKNHNVHSIEKVLSPQDMQHEELAFARLVGMAIGVPCSLILQGGGIVGGSSSLGGSNQGWSEGTEACNRMLLDTCRYINYHLEILLLDVHKMIYGSHNSPSIKIPLTPTVPFEQLVLAHETQIVDDVNISHVLDATWGFSLGAESNAARSEKRKAEYDLPFRDKKEESVIPKRKK